MTPHELAEFALGLAAGRDESITAARKANAPTDPGAKDFHIGTANGFRLALSALHNWSHGEYGVAYPDQPSPFELMDRGVGGGVFSG